jgi:hypothetical protein
MSYILQVIHIQCFRCMDPLGLFMFFAILSDMGIHIGINQAGQLPAFLRHPVI